MSHDQALRVMRYALVPSLLIWVWVIFHIWG